VSMTWRPRTPWKSARHVIGCQSTQEVSVQNAWRCRTRHLADIAHHVTGCQVTQGPRVQMRVDDEAGSIYLALPTRTGRRGPTTAGRTSAPRAAPPVCAPAPERRAWQIPRATSYGGIHHMEAFNQRNWGERRVCTCALGANSHGAISGLSGQGGGGGGSKWMRHEQPVRAPGSPCVHCT